MAVPLELMGCSYLNKQQLDVMRKYLTWFHNQVINGLGGVLEGEVKHFIAPREVLEVEDQVRRLQEAIGHGPGRDTADLPDDLIRIFKRMLIEVRRLDVAEIESLAEKTHNSDLLQTLDDKLKPLNKLVEQSWLKNAQPTKIPLLSLSTARGRA